MSEPARVLIWADRNQESLIERSLDTGLITMHSVGSPDDHAGRDFSDRFSVPQSTDLRASLAEGDFDIAWITARDVIDQSLRETIRSCSRPVATSTLPTDPVLDLLSETDHGMPARFVPRMRQSPGCISAMQLLEDFGRIECVHVSMTAGQQQTAPWSLLYDAMDMVQALLGIPDEVFAAHAGAHSLQPDVIAGITGHFSVALRFPGQAAASIVCSDGGGNWDRRVLVLGSGGRLIIDDHRVEWTMPDGTRSDPDATITPGIDHGAGHLAAHHLRRVLEGVEEAEAPETTRRVLALCESARVSCLTGQAEVPAQVVGSILA